MSKKLTDCVGRVVTRAQGREDSRRSDRRKKRYAVYIRVSGSSQSEELQINAAKKWAEANGIPWNEIEKFNEHSLSANKVVMENRPELIRLLNAIKSGQINCVLVFTRCRVARNFFEYDEITDIFNAAKIDVFFTCTETPPYSRDKLIEGIYGIQIQSEGQNIKARLNDVHNMNPHQKFGYVNDNKQYSADERYQYKIKKAFEAASKVEGFKELLKIILSYKKEFKRKDVEDTWKLLRTPFYAGYYQKGLDYFQLEHVEPIIELELFQRVQIVLDLYEQRLIDTIIVSREQSYLTPVCGVCKKKMIHKNTRVGEAAFYKCEVHKKHRITTEEINQTLEAAFREVINSISEQELKYVCIRSINNALKEMRKKKEELGTQLLNVRMNFAMKFGLHNQKEKDLHLKSVNSLLSESEEISDQIVDLSNTQSIVNGLVKIVKEGLVAELQKEKLQLFIYFLIKEVVVFYDSIELEVFLAEFLGGEKHVQK
ncbi:recombinase family protein [Bacillus salacetis]|uniref:recombinase family protein n=1 Tax=Bacillus salacetis TaxID=2315464 RepID=UPI003BA19A16